MAGTLCIRIVILTAILRFSLDSKCYLRWSRYCLPVLCDSDTTVRIFWTDQKVLFEFLNVFFLNRNLTAYNSIKGNAYQMKLELNSNDVRWSLGSTSNITPTIISGMAVIRLRLECNSMRWMWMRHWLEQYISTWNAEVLIMIELSSIECQFSVHSCSIHGPFMVELWIKTTDSPAKPAW